MSNWLQIQTMVNTEKVVGDSSAGDPETKGFNLVIDVQEFPELLTK